MFEALPERYTETMVLDLIVSKNVARRHLNPGQRAMAALEYEKAYAAATRQKRIETNGGHRSDYPEKTMVADLPPEEKSRERAARAVGSSGRAVQQAKAITRDAPDLADQVRSGKVALDAADRQRRERPGRPPS